MKSEAGLWTNADVGFVNNSENQRTGRRTSAQNFIFGGSIFGGISVCKEPIQIPTVVNIPTGVIVNFLQWPESRDSCLSDGFHIFLKLPNPKQGQYKNKDRNKVKDGYNYSEFDLHDLFQIGMREAVTRPQRAAYHSGVRWSITKYPPNFLTVCEALPIVPGVEPIAFWSAPFCGVAIGAT